MCEQHKKNLHPIKGNVVIVNQWNIKMPRLLLTLYLKSTFFLAMAKYGRNSAINDVCTSGLKIESWNESRVF